MSKLPPLPTPFRRSGQQIAEDFNDRVFCDLFSNEQMHAYAASATEPLLQRIAELEKALKLVQQHHATAWNRGHIAGIAANRRVAQDALNAVKQDAWNNTQLTEALMAAESRCEELERQLEEARAQIGKSEPVAWLVCSVNKDGSLSLEHAAAWQEAAHEHINDAITEHGIADAASWVVRPAYTHPAPQQKPLLQRIAELEAANEVFVKRQNQWNLRMIETERQLHEQAVSLEEARKQALEEAAKVCDERAMKNERACDGLDDEDATSLRSAAWQMSVCAADIRALKGVKK